LSQKREGEVKRSNENSAIGEKKQPSSALTNAAENQFKWRKERPAGKIAVKTTLHVNPTIHELGKKKDKK